MSIKNDFKGNIKTLLWIILITILVIVLLIPRKIINENFETLRGYTSETIYRDLKDITKYDNRMKEKDFISLIDDRSDELLMKRCYQIPGTKMENLMNDGINNRPCKARSFNVITTDFTEVIEKIVLNVQDIHDTRVKGLIHGPVYVLISQVPYYKNDKGQDIALQAFNVADYGFSPRYDQSNTNSNHTIFYKVIIIYSRYSKGWRLNETDLFKTSIMSWLDSNNISYEPQCFMSAIGTRSGPFKYGGCASSDGTIKIDDKTINSATCLGPKWGNNLLQSDTTDVKNTPSTYLILYVLNNNADSIKRFLYNKDTVDYPTPWQYVRNVHVPLRQNSNKNVECVSNDGINCLLNDKSKNIYTSLNDANSPDKTWQPVSCTYDNYNDPTSWCAQGYRALTDSNDLPKPAPASR